MRKNEDLINDDDLELIDLANDHLAAAGKGAKDAKKKEVRRRAEKERSNAPVAVLIFLLLAALGFCGYLMYVSESRKKELSDERAARAEDAARFEQQIKENEAVINSMNAAIEGVEQEVPADSGMGVTGTISAVGESVSDDTASSFEAEDPAALQTTVTDKLEDIKEAAAKEREDYIRDIMMAAALKEGGGPMTAVRAVFKDMAFYTVDKDTYEFAPLLDNVPRNDISEGQIVKDEDGTMHYMVDGVDKGIPMIDVSEFQGVIDWNKVAASGIKYAMIRAGFRGYGSGKLVEDKYIDDNIRGAAAAGIKFGVYFFSEAVTEEEAREEARVCIDHLAGYTPDLPIVLDVEHIGYDEARADALDQKTRTDVALAFVDEVKKAGYKPMLYTGLLVYFHYLDQSRISDLPLWYAFYSEYLYFPYKIKCWQYTDSATVPGINGKCDMSLWFVDPLGI
ncbi:MAG: glycoside hydrolase family 25 protein [Lachnospiraceae bacterium]|nr:glycoside hydrolase family 25 protein [Lachnospiraceae bacterium]